MPESQCTRCNAELIPAFKATSDWCVEHGLPESQCKICNPEIFGDDLEILKQKAAEVDELLRGVPGSADVVAEQVTGLSVLQVEVQWDAIARRGIAAREVLDVVEALGGIEVGEIQEGERRFPLAVRLHERFGGQFEHLEAARTRLLIVVPIALGSILLLLYFTYGRVRDSLRVFTGVPFAALGGIVALWLRDMPFSISAGIGFVALSGVAVLGDMVLVSTIRQLLNEGLAPADAVETAATRRLRPVLMTALVAGLGFVPMAINTGIGSEVQRPLATVVIGGVIPATLLTLVVLPALYTAFAPRRRSDRIAVAEPAP